MSGVCIYVLFLVCELFWISYVLFFFQAEDGIRDYKVTGVQTCALPISGPVRATDLSQVHDRVKTFQFSCERCGWQDRVAGREELSPPWDEASLQEIAYEHLMHLPAFCPFDHTPIVFISLPNPRRKARYRLSCFYCGRQAEMDWPPPEARREMRGDLRYAGGSGRPGLPPRAGHDQPACPRYR